MLDTFLFDLDGTLLPLDMDRFMKIYFGEMGKAFQDIIEPKTLVNHIWTATNTMVANTEPRRNEDVFMEKFSQLIEGQDLDTYKKRFDAFYDEGFLSVKQSVSPLPLVQEIVGTLKEKNYNIVVATNPLFPRKAIEHRINWAGLSPDDFSYITSYEANHYCKPNLAYYEEILQEVGKKAENCIMVGNDAEEDLVASKLGMRTFWVTDCAIKRTEEAPMCTYQGSYQDLYEFVKGLPFVK